MEIEDIRLSDVSQIKTNTIDVTCMLNLKKQKWQKQSKQWLSRIGDEKNQEIRSQGTKFQGYNVKIVIIVKNIVL